MAGVAGSHCTSEGSLKVSSERKSGAKRRHRTDLLRVFNSQLQLCLKVNSLRLFSETNEFHWFHLLVCFLNIH